MVEVLGYRRNFEIDGLLFPEAWDRYEGSDHEAAEGSLPRTFLYARTLKY